MLLICKYQQSKIKIQCCHFEMPRSHKPSHTFFKNLQILAINCSLHATISLYQERWVQLQSFISNSLPSCVFAEMFSRATGCFMIDSCFRVPSWSRCRRIHCRARASLRIRSDLESVYFSFSMFSVTKTMYMNKFHLIIETRNRI